MISQKKNRLIVVRMELVNYLRMSLTGITRLVYTPNTHIALQIFLGTNGSGKSSFLRELWPLPGEAGDFGTGGLKDQQIDYNNREYRLISRFTDKPRYEFWVDGENLNDGGKIDNFRHLCLEHFQVSNEIRNLAMGYEELTRMGPARRKYWMVKLADTDLSYAMRVYNSLKEAHRDASGSIRRLQQRLTAETAKLADKEITTQIQTEIREIKKFIGELQQTKRNIYTPVSEAFQKLSDTQVRLDTLVADAQRLDIELLMTHGFNSPTEIASALEALNREAEVTNRLASHTFEEFEKVEKKHDLLRQAGSQTIEELKLEMAGCIEARERELLLLSFPNIDYVKHCQPMEGLRAFESIKDDLFARLSEIPENANGYYSSKKRNELEEENAQLAPIIQNETRKLDKLRADIEHKENHLHAELIECPQCMHRWTNKISTEELAYAKKRIAAEDKALQAMQDKYAKNAAYIGEFNTYHEQYRAIVSLMRYTPALLPYFEHISQSNRLVQYPHSVAHELWSIGQDLERWVTIAKHMENEERIAKQMELKASMDADTLEEVEHHLKELEVKLQNMTAQKQTLRNRIADIQELWQLHLNVENKRTKLIETNEQRRKNLTEFVDSRYQEMLSEVLMGVQTQLARKEDALGQFTHQEQLVEDIKSQIQITTMQEKVSKAAHMALSPTHGAIAETLRHFNNVFVSKLNKTINGVWTYPIEILPVQMQDGSVEMDYKFPFKKNREERVLKDVDEGSESMLAIFNFAFRLHAIRQLGLSHLPLFLDELEAPFDDAHKERVIYFVKKLLDSGEYSQVFMVSHYESNHGALGSLAQTCVLNRDNVMLASNLKYNEHVVME